MSLFRPSIKKIVLDDVNEIIDMIDEAFPYVSFTYEKIKEKINNKNFLLLKSTRNNIVTGFLEIEFLDNNVARLNAVYVIDAFRRQGFATKLMKEAIHEIKRKRIKKFFLLVKENNSLAKDFYKKNSFVFEKLHDKKLEDSIVEVWVYKK